jgi:hypothetical protein
MQDADSVHALVAVMELLSDQRRCVPDRRP